MATLDQERAQFAWQKTEGTTKELKAVVSGAPALIMQNGLMQALAYYQEKKSTNEAVKRLLNALLERLARELRVQPDFEAVMRALQQADSEIYFRATEEALETLRWIRHFAKARAPR